MSRSTVIGIDPGVKTGFAVLYKRELQRLETVDFWGAHDAVMEYPPDTVLAIVVEVHPDSFIFHDNKHAGIAVAGKIGQAVGAVRVQGELLVARFQAFGYRVIPARPIGKDLVKRVFAQKFPAIRRSNQHERDAAILAAYNL